MIYRIPLQGLRRNKEPGYPKKPDANVYEFKMKPPSSVDYCEVRRLLFQTEACWRTPSWRGAVEERGVVPRAPVRRAVKITVFHSIERR